MVAANPFDDYGHNGHMQQSVPMGPMGVNGKPMPPGAHPPPPHMQQHAQMMQNGIPGHPQFMHQQQMQHMQRPPNGGGPQYMGDISAQMNQMQHPPNQFGGNSAPQHLGPPLPNNMPNGMGPRIPGYVQMMGQGMPMGAPPMMGQGGMPGGMNMNGHPQGMKPMSITTGKVYPPDQTMIFNSANPNAPPIYPCGACHKEVHENEQGIFCESGCNFWFHRACVGLSEHAFNLLNQEVYAEWVCDPCTRTKNIPLVKFKP